MATVYVDADACPVTRQAISVARIHRTAVVLVGNEAQNLSMFADRAGVKTVQVGTGPDSADFAIVAMVQPGDVVVTGDLGLAAMVLGRGAAALSPRGREFSEVTIDAELALRHAEKKHRRAGGKTGGPAAFDENDRERFTSVLARLLTEAEPSRPT